MTLSQKLCEMAWDMQNIPSEHQRLLRLRDEALEVEADKERLKAENEELAKKVTWLECEVERAEDVRLLARFTVPVVCICGSTRFADQHAIARWELERDGKHICLMINYLPHWYADAQGWEGNEHHGEASGCKGALDELHLRKIDLCDWVLVINIGGYIGDSTRSEIEYAIECGKPIKWRESDNIPEPFNKAALRGKEVADE